MNQGKYRTRYAGINLNNNNGTFSAYLNAQYTHKNTYDEIKTDRVFAADSMLRQDAITTYPGNNNITWVMAWAMSSTKNGRLSYDGRITLNDSHNSSS